MAETTAAKMATGDASYKETVESILVAFILAFIFRAFVVEAFVIPTGSMAPTLYGAHIRYQCPDCGYVFDAGFRAPENATGDDVNIPSDPTAPATTYHCPNCGYAMPTNPQRIRFGDRILVLKYLYLFQKPTPWDVVVFKSPSEQTGHVPADPEYGQNYIKRLIGVGPESVVILDGDIYTGPYDANRPLGDDGKPLFKIQRKPKYVQDALWRVINHSDFVPHKGNAVNPWMQPWQAESGSSGWTLSGSPSPDWPNGAPSREFNFSNQSGAAAITFNTAVNPETRAGTDFLVYDELEHQQINWQPSYVSDLKLSCDYLRKSGDGPLRLQLSRNADLFTAEFTPGQVRLLKSRRLQPDRADAADERQIGKSVALPASAGSRPIRIELINVDYRVSVEVDGKEILATTDDDYAPVVEALWNQETEQFNQRAVTQGPLARPLVRVDAHQQEATLKHVVLSRDVYYLSFGFSQQDKELWATTRKVSHLKAGEYFVMGDNSFNSSDARWWGDPVNLPHEGVDVESGRVPERFMLGKAFFVYWPAGYRMPLVGINAVPDFGEMRFIR